jgi:hypothetical protein
MALVQDLSGQPTGKNVNNLLDVQQSRVAKATERIGSIGDDISIRRAASGSHTKMRVVGGAIDRSMDMSNMTKSNRRTFSNYFKKLKGAGFSEGDISKLTDTLKMQSVESLENKTYIDKGVRVAKRTDLSSVKREMAGVSYGYDMSRSSERAIRYSGGKSAYGDAFNIGDEVTSNIATKLKTAANDYTKIANISSVGEMSKITDSGALSRFAKDLNVNVSDVSKGNISSGQLRLLQQNGK